MADSLSLQPGHVGLNVSDLEASTRFYSQALGLSTIHASEDASRRFAFMGSGGRLMLTLWQQSDGRFRKDTPGLHHLSFEVPTQDDVARFEKRLRELGVSIVHDGAVAHAEGAASGGVYFEDPDGLRLEIFAASGAEELPAPAGSFPTCGFF